jgi:hypothetical protein
MHECHIILTFGFEKLRNDKIKKVMMIATDYFPQLPP